MGTCKKVGMSGGDCLKIYEQDFWRYYYMYGRRFIMFGLTIAFAFFIGWYLHKRGYFPELQY